MKVSMTVNTIVLLAVLILAPLGKASQQSGISTPAFSITKVAERPNPYHGAVTRLSHDGAYIVFIGGKSYQATVVDRRTNAVVYHEDTGPRAGSDIAFSRNNEWFAYERDPHQVVIVHLPSKRRILVEHGTIDLLHALAFSVDGTRLALGVQLGVQNDAGDSVFLVETKTGRVLARHSIEKIADKERLINDLTFSPDGKTLLAATRSGDVTRLDAATLRPLGKVWEDFGVRVLFSPDGRKLVAVRHLGRGESHVVIADAASGAALLNPITPAPLATIFDAMAFTKEGDLVLGNGSFSLWDPSTGKQLGQQTLQLPPGRAIYYVRITSDGRRIYAASGDGTANHPFQIHEWEVTIDASRLERSSARADGKVPLGSAPSSEIIGRMIQTEPNCAAFVPGRDEAAVGVYGGDLGFLRGNALRRAGGGPEFPSRGEGSGPLYIHYVAVSHDGRYATAAWDGATMRMYEVATGRFVTLFARTGWGPDNFVTQGHGPHGFLADGRLALTWEHGLRIYDPQRGVAVVSRTYSMDSYPTAIATANNTSAVAIGTKKGALLLTAVEAVKPPLMIEHAHTGEVVEIVYSPNDHIVATGDMEGNVRLFDAETGARLHAPWRMHQRPVTALAFSADGQYLASGSNDGTVRIANLRTGTPVTNALPGHSGPVLAMSYERPGQWLSFGREGTMRRWRVATDDCAVPKASGATVIGTLVSLREKPAENARVLQTLPFGTRLRIADRGENCITIADRHGRWVRVQAADGRVSQEGWVFDAFLSYEAEWPVQ